MGTISAPMASSTRSTSVWHLPIIASIGSLVSIGVTGFVVGVRNDIYYFPILNALYNEPQFANDAFVQSLRYFSSGLWLLLSGAAHRVDTYFLLLFLDFVSRLISFLGFIACASLLGLKGWRPWALLTTLLCSTALLRGQSLAGDGGLFINYFTHSEIANGLTLILLFFVIRGWIVAAVVVNGLVFFINAFIGAWDAVMLGVSMAIMTWRGIFNWRQVLTRGLVGTALALPLLAPVIRNILANPAFGKPIDFDYVTYLEEFWPYHFIFGDISIGEKIGLTSIVALGLLAFVRLGRQGVPFIVAMTAFAGLYVIGIFVPAFTHDPLVLNLHLLRVSTMLQLLAILGSLALATRWWFSESPAYKYFFSPLLILLLCAPIKMTTVQPAVHCALAILLVAASFYPSVEARIPSWLRGNNLRLNYAALVVAVIGLLAISVRSAISNVLAQTWHREWEAVGNWARDNTAPNATFLVRTWNFRDKPASTQPGGEENEAILNSGAFESIAHRVVWIDFRDGAAVLWLPSYYKEWHQRVSEVNSLASFAAKTSYARDKGIKYLVDVCESNAERKPVFSTKRLCVYSLS